MNARPGRDQEEYIARLENVLREADGLIVRNQAYIKRIRADWPIFALGFFTAGFGIGIALMRIVHG